MIGLHVMDTTSDKSKTQLKRELHALQDLGRELVSVPDKHLSQLPLSEQLAEAIRFARTLKRGALQRQLRFIGGLLAREDATAIAATLQAVTQPDHEAVTRFHDVERWRDDLIARGEPAVDDFLGQHPSADRQQLRRLVRNALNEQQAHKPPKSARALFRFLKDFLDTVA